MNVRVDLKETIRDGMEVVFKAPCDYAEVTGLVVYYPVSGVIQSRTFAFADAHANDLATLDVLFAKDAVVKVILDLSTNMAFVQNADTNAYLEGRLARLEANSAYYSTLSGAIADINNSTKDNATKDAATIKVAVGKADNGATTVTLLDDVTESVLIEVNKDIVLVLNGYTLHFDAPAAYLNFTAGTNCTISGEVEGSAITKSCDSTSVVYMMQISSDNFRIVRGRYHCSGNMKMSAMITHNSGVCEISDAVFELETGNKASGSLAYCVQAKSTQKLTMTNCNVSSRGSVMSVGILLVQYDVNVDVYGCNISAVTLPDESVCKGKAYGIKLNYDTILRIEDSTVFSDGPGDDAGETYTQGISSFGTIFCKNTNVTGTQSGVCSNGKLYVSGGTFTGYSHGGFYLSDTEKEGYDNEAYINDAVIQNGNYTGEFTDIFAGDTVTLMGGIYIGSGSNITAYLDSCTINENNPSYWGMVLRGSSNETNNVVNISNSTVGGMIRIDNETLRLNVGVGTNINASKIREEPSFAVYTNAVYRKHHPDEQLNGNDYGALVKTVKAEPKMELLETITVGDTDLGTVVRDFPNLDAISLVVNCPATSTTGKIQPRFHYPTASGGNYATMHNVTVTNADAKHQATIEFYKRYGVWRYEWAVNRPEWGAAFNALMRDTYSLFGTEMPYVNKITLITTTLPSGTTIKIYGVRRNED